MSAFDDRPYQPIEASARIGTCEGCAPVARDGAIDRACLERFDADPIFSRLLDRRRGGWFTIQPTGRFETERHYVSRTNILETTFSTPTGLVTPHDFMVPATAGADRSLRETASRRAPRMTAA